MQLDLGYLAYRFRLRGRGTYIFSAVLIGVGFLAFIIPDATTWSEPQGLGPIKQLFGGLAIVLAGVTIRLRLAIANASSDVMAHQERTAALLEGFIESQIHGARLRDE